MKTTNSKTKTFAFLGAAFVLLIALLFTGCPQAAAKPEEPPASTDKTYTVKGISFTMKKIAA
ncbi:MAG: InlB B-repeat-containing protein, partial [Treponema lecithinolyticum]